jgi:DinB family protein
MTNRGEMLAARLAAQFDAWTVIVGDPSSAELERRPGEGTWNAREHLAHIARMHGVCAARIRVILARDRPVLPAYRMERDASWERWRAHSVEDLLAVASGRRVELMETVRELADSALDRVGVHVELGPLALAEWLEFFLVHEAHHLYAVFKLARAK